jgi:hypothetical protein
MLKDGQPKVVQISYLSRSDYVIHKSYYNGYLILNKITFEFHERANVSVFSKEFEDYTFKSKEEADVCLKKFNRIRKLIILC